MACSVTTSPKVIPSRQDKSLVQKFPGMQRGSRLPPHPLLQVTADRCWQPLAKGVSKQPITYYVHRTAQTQLLTEAEAKSCYRARRCARSVLPDGSSRILTLRASFVQINVSLKSSQVMVPSHTFPGSGDGFEGWVGRSQSRARVAFTYAKRWSAKASPSGPYKYREGAGSKFLGAKSIPAPPKGSVLNSYAIQ